MANHLVTSVLYLGCSIVFILCIVALVAKNAGELGDEYLMNTKAVYTICKVTQYKADCKKALVEVGKNTSSTKKDYIFASFHKTMDELKNAQGMAVSIRKGLHGKKDDYSRYARSDLKNCEKLLGQASDELQQLLKVSSKLKTVSLAEITDPMLVWLTAVRAYQTTCVDEIKDEQLKKNMQHALDYANKHTYNSQNITYHITDILLNFGVDLSAFKISSSGHHRVLEELDVIGHQGFPSWFSAADRRLLGDDDKEKDDDDDEDDEDDHKHQPIVKGHGLFLKTPEPEALKSSGKPKPNVIVASDGSGKFKSIKEALAAYPPNHKGRYIIYVKAGVYDEGQIIVNKNQNNVYMYGDGRGKTVVTGDGNFGFAKTGTSQTATFIAQGERFMAKGIGFRNTIGPGGHQAVAFLSQSPQTVIVDCSFEGYQDTLYYHTHDQFYKNCSISGTVDFIFGSGRAFIQDSEIYVRKPADTSQSNTIIADGKMKGEEAGGVVLQKCKIKASKELEAVKGKTKSYLGRPWKPYAKTVVMQCNIGDLIDKKGWTKWEDGNNNTNHETCMFKEYSNEGSGSHTDGRVKWPGFKVIKNKKEAAPFTADPFMDADSWLPQAGIKI